MSSFNDVVLPTKIEAAEWMKTGKQKNHRRQLRFEAAGVDPVKIENEWAIHQVKTTANFAFSNRIVTWFVGGLNYQIEHHLFPRISHIHYPAISEIVKQTCEQFDLYYNYFPTTRAAIASHVRFMHTMGQRPQAYLGL